MGNGAQEMDPPHWLERMPQLPVRWLRRPLFWQFSDTFVDNKQRCNFALGKTKRRIGLNAVLTSQSKEYRPAGFGLAF
jgi:hypothetical protein